MLLSEAVQQVGQDENPEAAYIRLFADQMQPDKFQRWFQIVRQVPVELVTKMQDHATLAPHDAFKMCYPDHVNVGEFINAVNESRMPQDAPQQPSSDGQPIANTQPIADEQEGAEGAI